MKIEKLFERYRDIVDDYDDFIEFLRKPLRRSFRLNTLKANKDDTLRLISDIKVKPLAFYPDGFVTEQKTSLGKHVAHSLGLIYVQEIASMLPACILDPRPDEYILDLCAAPGSKTTQIGQMMGNTGLLVVNEISRGRIAGLVHNTKRCGLLNEVVTNIPGQRMGRVLTDYFDRVMIDAPCSAEGTIRRSKAVLYHWGEKNIERMSRIQKGLIVSGYQALRNGGSMVYSTCTIAPEENEAVVSYLLEKFPEADVLPVALPAFKFRPGIKKWRGISFHRKVKNCVRVLPQDNDTAPFFIALIAKRGFRKPRVGYLGKIEFNSKAAAHLHDRFGISTGILTNFALFQDKDIFSISSASAYMFRELRALRRGLEAGKIYEQGIKPDNDFIQIFGRNALANTYTVNEQELNVFLKGGTIRIDRLSNAKNGFVIVMYRRLPIGIGRCHGGEIKSSIKRERRIPYNSYTRAIIDEAI